VRTQISASWRHGACINCLRIRTYAVGRWQCWLESGQPNVADVDQAMATRFGTLLISWSTTSSARASACPSTPSLLFCMASAASVHRETMSHVVAAFWRLPAQWPSRQLSWRRFPAASHAPSSRQPRMLTHGASVHSIDGRIKRAYHGSWVACFRHYRLVVISFPIMKSRMPRRRCQFPHFPALPRAVRPSRESIHEANTHEEAATTTGKDRLPTIPPPR
jgi:hypothetical protein